ncbi:hypothetical protein FNV43_RR27177 [Rhamnella rubrinervis]|uniref:Leucine-rich repeat-containing N-terminal plant-type domain-containing protein n=1 Tax=Rhamnella rubrinervis TaxID=2594499 RepID=A0A8K0DJW9_9ROSA|nr:hypothetical protein FNV43_RR27177 [Rhamnella rubrinervis]
MAMAIIRIAIALYFWLFTLSIIRNCMFCSGNNSSVISCIETERQALLSLKQDLYDPSNRLASWVGEDCCKWSGIICHNITGHVRKLILRSPPPPPYLESFAEFEAYKKTLLGGKISPTLLNLKHLHHLDLSNNDFGGNRIPKFLGSLASLRYLNLSQARFDGMVPCQIGNLTNLRTLDLHDVTTFNGYAMNIQWISHLSLLRYLDLTFKFPKWVFNIRSLTSLDLSGNYFIGPIWEGIQNLTSLMHLDLSSNYFNTSSIPRSLYGLSRLEFLNLARNQLSGTISSDIKNLTSIVSLDLSWNDLEGKLPTVGTQLCKLKEIHLSGNKWNQSISQVLDSFCGCVSDGLEVLDITYSQLFGRLDRSQIWKFKALTEIDLSRNSISGHIPASLGNVSSLRSVVLSHNHFDGSLPESFGQLTKLEGLYISNNYLEGTISEAHFANTTKLRGLYASDSQLTLDVSPSWIPPFQLEELSLSSLNLGPQFPLWPRSQEHFTYLDISKVRTDAIVLPSWFWNFSAQLRFLNLSHNHFQGRIPYISNIGNDGLEIDLSYNHFELASIPSRLANLEAYIQSLELDELMHRVEALESLANKVRALERQEPPPVSAKNRAHTSSTTPREEHASAVGGAVVELMRVVNELSEDIAMTVDTLKREIADLSTKVNVTMVTIGNSSPPSTGMDYRRIKVPEPWAYGGARDAKELKNFFFDMEQYF